ncbi:ribosomal protein S18-alanine N-acetyltransferase [Acaricomes phytoseiuli]|uniref:ribosomal protein S18-alanine N-acetyltransferase n=1 Tax=Acaricomes phytoseiuli TaxID=291968 RepID=UPI00035D2AC1|nr:ribosomal protein S18-alanine N-acetyltransferase [Acaricomes phytoseiuli]MCW1250114.1 ribosomal protein S18-alanine N-acetyltransferase [Acaricomes phytoseiuli]
MTEHLLPEGIRLRGMTAEDIDAVAALEEKMFPLDAWPKQAFVQELRESNRHYLVAALLVGEGAETEAGSPAEPIAGYAGLFCLPPVGDIQTIAVDAEYQGRGIGAALLSGLLDAAWQRGAREVLLEVRQDNPKAQSLYRGFGFEHIHTRPKYYRDGTGALVMRLRKTTKHKEDEKGTRG